MGLFAAAPGVAALSIVMKGREIHGGQAHRLWTDLPNKLDLSKEMVKALVTNEKVTMRMGLVLYPSERAFGRRSSAHMYPPCGFGPTMPYRSGVSKDAYVSDGGRRLFASAELQRSYVLEEVAMQIGNIAARLGCDPQRAVEAFSSNLYDKKEEKLIALRHPPWQWDAKRKNQLDGYLSWHILISRIFLLNVDIEKKSPSADAISQSHLLSIDALRDLYSKFVKDYSNKRKESNVGPHITSILNASSRPKDNVSIHFKISSFTCLLKEE